MSAEELVAWIDQLPADSRPQDSRQLARELVRQKKLTAFQAQQIYAGKGRSLLLANYVILDKLGQSGMGMVLKARHRRMELQHRFPRSSRSSCELKIESRTGTRLTRAAAGSENGHAHRMVTGFP
jgi:hypothetical protein